MGFRFVGLSQLGPFHFCNDVTINGSSSKHEQKKIVYCIDFELLWICALFGR